SPSKVYLPAIAAVGGMVFPALIFALFNHTNTQAIHGWAIPTATDIAFSLGILSLLGSRVPLSLKIFLTTLAIFDDLGAIIVIAIFYTSHLSFLSLGLAMFFVIFLFLMNRFGVKAHAPYFIIGAILWLCVLESGVHATLAGVVIAFAMPLRDKNQSSDLPPYRGLLERLHPWIAYCVLPLFALGNAGVSFADVPPGLGNIFSPVMLGVAAGLLFGKLIGVFGTTFLAIKLGIAKKPAHSTWPQIFGIALICGVGFTMSFFIGTLAYPPEATEPYAAWVRLGVILGSLTSGTLGYLVLRFTTKNVDAQ
ncbi:MAG: Na+/H+ antiporter NhaA, partial [Myxococcales bacterium]|nr:Na+/H+ antiporter NhaA [Myxococcales bacterium]